MLSSGPKGRVSKHAICPLQHPPRRRQVLPGDQQREVSQAVAIDVHGQGGLLGAGVIGQAQLSGRPGKGRHLQEGLVAGGAR